MAWPVSRARAAAEPTASAKILVTGGFGVGKTTAIRAVSEVDVLSTEAMMTDASFGFDDIDAVPHKTTTTVAMDYGRLTLDTDLRLYLFGTPGQDRFWMMWDELARGALAALVLVDTRRLEASFAALNYFDERNDIPYIVAINAFDGQVTHPTSEVREALDLAQHIPLAVIDARETDEVLRALRDLIDHALNVVHV